jgi:hypothetical protein
LFPLAEEFDAGMRTDIAGPTSDQYGHCVVTPSGKR